MDRRHFLGGVLVAGMSSLVPRVARGAVANSSNGWWYFDRNLLDATHTRIGDTISRGLAEVAFTPSGGWVVVGGDGSYEARGIPDECFSKMVELINAGHKINCIAFPPQGGNRWIIITEVSLFARNIPQTCYEAALEMQAAGEEIYRVAFRPGGGWIILSSGGWRWEGGIPSELRDQVAAFQANGTTWPEQVAFTPSNGWVLIGRNGYFARNIPDECFQRIGECWNAGFRVTRIAFSPGGGWHVGSNDRVTLPATSGGLAAVRTTLASERIPGLAAVVIQGNAVTRAHYYGVNHRGSNNAVNAATRFQCASISKAVTTAGVLRLLQLGTVTGLTLDTDLRGQLGFTPSGAGTGTPAITLRQLLTHTGGFNVSGFSGYRRTVATPNTLGVLDGSGNSGAVARRAVDLPATSTWRWQYSGGGFTLVQRYIEMATGQAFGTWMWNNLLSPMGMSSSRFIEAPTWGETSLAVGHDVNGYVVPHRRNHYPELAAAGLYATAADLARFVITVNRGGVTSNGTTLWSVNMLAGTNYPRQGGGTTRMGLGVFLGTEGANALHWDHGGVNWGFRGVVWGNPTAGNGVVVLANHDNANNAVATIKNAYLSTYGL